jgi:tetratricopeptide (TPR) repeat protein
LQPGYAQACFNLGSFYQSQGKNSQALEYYGKAAMLEPSSADTHMNMGYIYAGEGNYENAIYHSRRH